MLSAVDCRKLLTCSPAVSAVAVARQSGVALAEVERLFHEVHDSCGDVEVTYVVSWNTRGNARALSCNDQPYEGSEASTATAAVSTVDDSTTFTRGSIVLCTTRNEAEALCATREGLSCTVYQLRTRQASSAESANTVGDEYASSTGVKATNALPPRLKCRFAPPPRLQDVRPYPLVWRSSMEEEDLNPARATPAPMAKSSQPAVVVKQEAAVRSSCVPPVSAVPPVKRHPSLPPTCASNDTHAPRIAQTHAQANEEEEGESTNRRRRSPAPPTDRVVHHDPPLVRAPAPSPPPTPLASPSCAESLVCMPPPSPMTHHDAMKHGTSLAGELHDESATSRATRSASHESTALPPTCTTPTAPMEKAEAPATPTNGDAAARKRPLSVFDIMCSSSSASSSGGAVTSAGRGAKKPRKERPAAAKESSESASTTRDGEEAAKVVKKANKKTARERKADALSTCKSLAKLARASARNARAKAAGAAVHSSSSSSASGRGALAGMLDDEEEDDSERTQSAVYEDDTSVSRTTAPCHSGPSAANHGEGANGSDYASEQVIHGVSSALFDVQVTPVNDDIILCDQAPPLAFCSPERPLTSAAASIAASASASASSDTAQQRTLSGLFNPAVVAFQKQYVRETQTEMTFVKGEYVCQDVVCYRDRTTSEIISELDFHRRTAEVASRHAGGGVGVGGNDVPQHRSAGGSAVADGADAAAVVCTTLSANSREAAYGEVAPTRSVPASASSERKRSVGGGVRVSKQAPPPSDAPPAKTTATLLSFFKSSSHGREA